MYIYIYTEYKVDPRKNNKANDSEELQNASSGWREDLEAQKEAAALWLCGPESKSLGFWRPVQSSPLLKKGVLGWRRPLGFKDSGSGTLGSCGFGAVGVWEGYRRRLKIQT